MTLSSSARSASTETMPRRSNSQATAPPFLCLIELHLLCPDMALLPHVFEKAFVDARIVGQLRVERGDHEAPLAQQHRLAVELCEHFDLRPDVANARRADEDAA